MQKFAPIIETPAFLVPPPMQELAQLLRRSHCQGVDATGEATQKSIGGDDCARESELLC
ncbi:MAG: hypothetical protein AB1589_16315 [Cyanobacteriota bacterium]